VPVMRSVPRSMFVLDHLKVTQEVGKLNNWQHVACLYDGAHSIQGDSSSELQIHKS
jgi:hypothetical protein